MIYRIWRTGYCQSRRQELEEFAVSISGPMFRRQKGCCGYDFVVRESEWLTITLWQDDEAIRNMEASIEYQETVARIKDAGFLTGEQGLAVYEVVETWRR